MNQPAKKKPAKFNFYPFWSPRFWHGMRWGDWMRFWASKHFRAHPLRLPMAILITLITPVNSLWGWLQDWWLRRELRVLKIEKPPIFIIGHWRSGTTFLHELMFLDDRYGSPNTYQCFAPHHFIFSERIIAKYGGFLLPKHRPMDNMLAGWDRPQEDEFALLTMNAPTPYFRCAYPNDPPPYMETLDWEGVSPADEERFQQALVKFLKLLTMKYHKQILLKSPPHTGRVKMLSKMFPGAKFVHITRDPYSLFSSTMRLWRALDDVQGFYFPRYSEEQHKEFVFECLERMYRGLEKQRAEIPAENIYDVKYEDLVKDPVGLVEKIYANLKLGDFESLRPKLEAFAAGQKDYKPNVHEFEPELKAEIRRRWSGYFERYGYE